MRSCGLPCSPRTLAAYRRINEALWADYRRGRIDPPRLARRRFELLLGELGAPARHAGALSRRYLAALARRGDLLPACRSTLRHLGRRYALGVVTNGLDRVQRGRLRAAGLRDRFRVVVTSERAGVVKPDPAIMHLALDALRIRPAEALYVGDLPEADGLVAARAGVAFCWVENGRPFPRGVPRPRYRIRALPELPALLDGGRVPR